MTDPATVLAEALDITFPDYDDPDDGPPVVIRLREGYRLTNEPELTEERLATALIRVRLPFASHDPARILAALKEAKP